MRVLLFGNFDPNYSRNRIVRKALEENGVEIDICNTRRAGIFKYADLYNKYKEMENQYDYVYVGFPGYQAAIFARLICRGQIIFDAFSSIHDSQVFDRKLVKEKSLKGRYYKWLDKTACKSADKVIVDTKEHAKYFMDQFNVPKEKIFVLYVGSDDGQIEPMQKEDPRFIVHFHGTCIPLQGIKHILGAARLLLNEQIVFNIIGTKIKNTMAKDAPSNVNFFDSISYSDLGKFMAEADICLGIFGSTDKAKRVIPNKVFEAAAASRAIITGESRAVKEIFTNKKDILFCDLANSKDLAEKIMYLHDNSELKDKIATNAYNLFKEKLTPQKLGQQLVKIINA